MLRTSVDKKEDFFKFGRKFVPQTDEHHKDVESDESREEETEEDRDAKQEETIREIEDKEAKDDNIDEHDQDKGDKEEHEHLFESTEEEEKHVNDKRNNDEENEHGEVDVFDKQEHDGSTQEAREENYKRDDASSAVAHDDHATESETGALNIDAQNANYSKGTNDTKIDVISIEIPEKKVQKYENVTNETDEGTKNDSVQENYGEITEASANAASETDGNLATKVFVNETVQINSGYPNSTRSDGKDDNGTTSDSTINEYKSEQQANSANLIEVLNNSTTSTTTMLNDISTDLTQIQGISNDNRTSNEDKASLQSLQNTTTATGDVKTLPHTIVVEYPANHSTTAVDKLKSDNTIPPNEKDATTPYLNDFRNATQDSPDVSAQGGVTEEERNSRIDLSTLPTIQTEVSTIQEDEAVE